MARHAMTRYDMARYGMARYDMARYGKARFGMARYDTARYGMTRYHMARHDMARYGCSHINSSRKKQSVVTGQAKKKWRGRTPQENKNKKTIHIITEAYDTPHTQKGHGDSRFFYFLFVFSPGVVGKMSSLLIWSSTQVMTWSTYCGAEHF